MIIQISPLERRIDLPAPVIPDRPEPTRDCTDPRPRADRGHRTGDIAPNTPARARLLAPLPEGVGKPRHLQDLGRLWFVRQVPLRPVETVDAEGTDDTLPKP